MSKLLLGTFILSYIHSASQELSQDSESDAADESKP